jgi:hypothetical protein
MKIASTVPILLALGATILAAGRGVAQRRSMSGRVFTDKVIGLRISIPSGWVSLPIHVDERRVVGWFQSTARYAGDAKKGDVSKPSPAVMKIVCLDKPVAGAKRVYGYEYWLSKTQKTGTYKSRSEPGVAHHDHVPVVKWDVRIAGPGIDRRRVVTWVFSGEKQDYAVEFRFLEEHVEALRRAAARSWKSFRLIPAMLELEAPYAEPRFVLRDWLKLPLLERHRRRAAIGKSHENKVRARLLHGWTVLENEHFLVLSHTDGKTTRHALDLVSAFRGWLDARFGSISEEYPIRTIVRICANASEYRSYRSGGWRADYNFGNREVVMANDGGALNMKEVLWGVYRRYMLDMAPDVYFNQPTWFAQAMRGLVARARLKGRKLVFPPSPEERSIFDELRRTGRARIWKAAELIKHPDFGYIPDKNPMDRDLILQALVLFRFLEDPGKRCRGILGRGFITEYVKGIRDLVHELDAENEDVLVWDSDETLIAKFEARRAAAETPEERAERPATPPGLTTRWTTYLRTVRGRRVEFANKLFARTCSWSEKEWAQIERGFERFYGRTR